MATCLKTSALWEQVQVMKLLQNMRVQLIVGGLGCFIQHLLEVGEGRVAISRQRAWSLLKSTPMRTLCSRDSPSPSSVSMCSTTWHHSSLCRLCMAVLMNHSFCPMNDGVAQVNDILIKDVPGKQTEYPSSDRPTSTLISSLIPLACQGCLHERTPVCPILPLRNLDPANGHCDQSRYIVTSLHNHIIVAAVEIGVHAGMRLFIPRISVAPTNNVFQLQMQRHQFSIIGLCFGITANKAQGQTLQEIGI